MSVDQLEQSIKGSNQSSPRRNRARSSSQHTNKSLKSQKSQSKMAGNQVVEEETEGLSPQPHDFKFFDKLKQLDELLGPSICSLCERNILKSIKIRCLDCPATDNVVLCLECLRTGYVGEEANSKHLRSHDYFVYDNLNFPLLSTEWNAHQELMLIQGIMKCGMGNWVDISEQFVKAKSPQQCEEHYFSSVYKASEPGQPIEYQGILKQRGTDDEESHVYDQDLVIQERQQVADYQQLKNDQLESEEREFYIQASANASAVSGTTNGGQNGGALGANVAQPITPASATQTNARNQQNNQRRDGKAKQNCQEVLGYLPKRGDFEQEYDMDAELLLADMEFFDDDTPENIELKNNVIELYNARLDERIRRKKFVIERGLLDLKKVQKYERKKTKEERDIINAMKIFARFQSEEEHQRLVNNLLKERLLREVIEQLKYFRSKGLTSIDQIEKFIEAQKVKSKNQGNNYDKSYQHQYGSNSASVSQAANQQIAKYEQATRFLKEPEAFLGAKPLSVAGNARQGGGSKEDAGGLIVGQYEHLLADDKWAALNNNEKQFCTNVNLKPVSYLLMKRHIQFENAKNRSSNYAYIKESVEKKDKIPASLREQLPLIYDFMVRANLVKQFGSVLGAAKRAAE